jgi:peroxiredoxin
MWHTGVALRVSSPPMAAKEEARSPGAPLVPLSYIAFVLLAGALVYGFVSVVREGETRRRCSAMCILKPDYAAANKAAPAFALPNMKGQTVSLDSYKGKVVVLNFWTKTCGPCLQEMPEIMDLTKIVKDRSDVAVVTISTDEGPDDVRDTLKSILREEAPFEVLFDPDSKIVAGKFGTHLFPETWIIDKRGVIRARFDGARQWSNAAVVEVIDQLRNGGYCPVEMQDGKATGEAARLCEELQGS